MPLAVFTLDHCTFEVWGPDEGHKHGHVRTVFKDGLTVPAAPNGDETLLDTALHEMSHHLVAMLTHRGPSLCLRAVAEGDGRRWTDARRAEEDVAFAIGRTLAELVRLTDTHPSR